MKKIILINHTFQIPRFYRRWELFAREHPDMDVTLLTPSDFKWETSGSMIFGTDTSLKGVAVEHGNFRIVPVKTKNIKYLGWVSDDMVRYIREHQPDLVYHIGIHSQLSLIQCIRCVRRHVPGGKVVAFSMRGPALSLRLKKTRTNIAKWCARLALYAMDWLKLQYFNRNCDAVLCHYPDAVKCFRDEGFKGPIYMSTQVGVNPEYYHPDERQRREIRERLNLGDSFVFGAAARFIPSKGLFEIIDALPADGDWKCLLMGKGTDEFTSAIGKRIADRGLEDKIRLTGYIEWDEIAKYWNAIDCAIHVPQTTPEWEETFSLAVVQAMATAKPVIGNTSGSVPYQTGPDGVIVTEGDSDALAEAIRQMMTHPDEAKEIGDEMYRYATGNFSIQHLNDQFYEIVNDILKGTYSQDLVDMTKYRKGR